MKTVKLHHIAIVALRMFILLLIAGTSAANADWKIWASDKHGIAAFNITESTLDGATFVFRSEDTAEPPPKYVRTVLKVRCSLDTDVPISMIQLEAETGVRDAEGKMIPQRVESFRDGKPIPMASKDAMVDIWRSVGRDVCRLWRSERTR